MRATASTGGTPRGLVRRLFGGDGANATALWLLLGGVIVAAAETRWLEVRGVHLGTPTPAGPLFLAYGICLALSYVAGRRVPRDTPARPVEAASFSSRASALRRRAALAFGIASFVLFAATWFLQSRRPVPLAILGAWLGSIIAGGVAFGMLSAGSPREPRKSISPGAAAVLFLLLAGGAWARLAALSAVPATLGGDEANQIMDAIGLIRGTVPGVSPGDPFGTGWYGSMRLGLLPSGAAALALPDPVAGPRLPFALAGTVALLAATWVGWLVGGTWGAIGTAALLSFAPYSVHFSRIASHMVLDSMLASIFLALALRTRTKGSVAAGFWTGVVAGAALYSYSAGRAIPVLFFAAAPFLVGSPAARGRRAVLAFALASGLVLAAAPGLRFAVAHFPDWNGRFNQVEIFRKDWWVPEVAKLGSPAAVLSRQVLAGTVGLLAWHTSASWYTAYPIVAPFLLPALAMAGFGWLLGRGRWFAVAMLGLVVAANLAAVMLTDSAPAPQRLSSLFPALAILGGGAVAGLVSLVGRRGADGASVRATTGALILGLVLLLSVEGLPPWWDRSPGYGGEHAAFALAASRVLSAPRFRGETTILDALPLMDSKFPSLPYLLPATAFVDRDVKKAAGERPPPGLHLISPDYLATLLPEWKEHYGISRAVLLPDPDDPRRDIGAIIRVR
jgi:hypothetical protein